MNNSREQDPNNQDLTISSEGGHKAKGGER